MDQQCSALVKTYYEMFKMSATVPTYALCLNHHRSVTWSMTVCWML